MRYIAFTNILISLAVAPYAALGAPGLVAPNVTVGRNLQTCVSVGLPKATESSQQITVTSDDPSRLLLSAASDRAGSAAISLTVQPHFADTPEFCIQAMADSGTVTYTVSAEGMGTAKGTVTLAPSAILVLGPTRVPKFPTTPGGSPARIRLVSAALDSTSLKVVREQQVAGGLQLDVTVANSNPSAGKLGVSKLTMAGGASMADTSFKPAAEGDTTITPSQPAGFTTPAEYASVTASVSKPGLAPVGDVFIGKDLQLQATICLGEAAPVGGLKVTMSSAEGSKLLLSAKEDQLGTPSLTLTVPEGQLIATYYIQALGDSGFVTYEASAPGFKTSTAKVGLTHSGFIVAYEGYGPPDEAAVRRLTGYSNSRAFYASLEDAKVHPMHVTVYSVYIDPATGRAADITVQPLRPGVKATVVLTSSDPSVGTVDSPVIISSGASQVKSRLVLLDKGQTLITINTPDGFATPGNATGVPATVGN